jgi:hypothetical protein
MVTNYSNINKPKESLSNRDGKQFLQYQQNKRKFIKHRWSTILPISFILSFHLLIMVELLTITVKTFFWFLDIGGIVDHHCLNFPISTNKNKVLAVMVDNSTNINKPKECFDSDGKQFYQYQQTKRKF